MRCHYIKVTGVGRVLIPNCMAVAVSGDIEDCTCSPTTFAGFEREAFNEEVNRLKKIIKELEKENKHYCKLLENKKDGF